VGPGATLQALPDRILHFYVMKIIFSSALDYKTRIANTLTRCVVIAVWSSHTGPKGRECDFTLSAILHSAGTRESGLVPGGRSPSI
jgi:hypothetical protein